MPSFSLSTRFSLLIGIAPFLFLMGMAQPLQAEWQFLKPASGQKTVLRIAGKDRNYYKLDDAQPLTVKVTGPGRLRFFTRAVCPEKDDLVYSFVVLRDDKERFHVARVTSTDTLATNNSKSSEGIGQSRTATFNIPAGEHEYGILLPKDADRTVYARVLLESKGRPKVDYVAYLPRLFAAEVKIIVSEHEYLYYRGGDQKPVEVEAIGPTKLKGIARLEFDHTMRGERQFRVQVLEDGKVTATHPFKSTPSGTAAYREKSGMLLGGGETFYIDIPKGKHRYLIQVPESGYDVLFRFYMPQKDLGKVDGSLLIRAAERLRG